MNSQPVRFLGLEYSNNGDYVQIRLRKPHLAPIGRNMREGLLVSCTLLGISSLAVVTIVWVVTALADLNPNSATTKFQRLAPPLMESSHTDQHHRLHNDYDPLYEARYYEQVAYYDQHSIH